MKSKNILNIMKMNKAIFLDRDGTLNVDKGGFAHRLGEFELIDGVVEGLSLLKKKFYLFIITNQSGVGLKKFTENDLKKFNGKLINELKKEKIEIKKIYYCIHKPEENCNCRKPKTKMILDAAEEFDIELKKSFMIGDKGKDVELIRNVGGRGVLVLTGHGEKFKDAECDYVAKDMLDAAKWILMQ